MAKRACSRIPGIPGIPVYSSKARRAVVRLNTALRASSGVFPCIPVYSVYSVCSGQSPDTVPLEFPYCFLAGGQGKVYSRVFPCIPV